MNRTPKVMPGPFLRPAEAVNILYDALERMPYGFSAWSDDFRLLFWNQGYLDIYGLPHEQMRKGMSLRSIVDLTIAAGNHPGVSAEELEATLKDRLSGNRDPGSPRIYEKVIRGRIIETTYLPSPDLGWLVIHEDLTEPRRREAELAAQHQRLDAALDSMPYGFCLWERDFTLVLWNECFVDLYGLDRREVTAGMSLKGLFLAAIAAGHHEGRTAGELTQTYRERISALDEGKTFVCEEVLESGRIVRVSWKPMPDGSLVSTHQDVTAEKDRMQQLQQREAELEQQNIRFAAAVDNMSHALCMFDADQKLIICNKRYADIYGLPEALVRPGTTLREILDHRFRHGMHPKGGASEYVQRRLDMVNGRKETSDTVELQDGRIISVLHHPMADGGWVATHQDVTDERRQQDRIRHLARHDGLTDLPNRLQFRENMEDAEAMMRRRETVAILLVDLDHFKSVNDLYGHGAGDAVLREVAERLKASCREGDSVGRLGGDEFAVLMGPLAHPEDAAGIADRIVRAMAVPMEVESHRIGIGASIGIAIGPVDGADADTLMKNADLALYRAKAEGRGTYHFFEPGMDAALQERLTLEIDLRAALAKGELSLAYQPLFSLAENRICGFEALLRWNHPERGTIFPDKLVPLAEESGLIVPIGAWALGEACRAAAAWPRAVRVAVNLSAIQFKHRDLLHHVKSALAASDLPPDRLELEITESVLLTDNESTVNTLHQIRALGVRISMDDFGTGYSSLSYLRSFPFDKIKIDQSFIRDLSDRPDSLAIIKAVIGLGRSLGIATTAEGVETETQLDLVREEGCTEVQGYLFSPPLPASAIGRLFAVGGEPETAADRRSAS